MEKNKIMMGNTKDDEFKTSLSIEDIDKIHDKIQSMDTDDKKILDGSNTSKIENNLTVKKQDNNIAKGVILFNTCMTCNSKFIPVNSMMDELSCTLCLNKNK